MESKTLLTFLLALLFSAAIQAQSAPTSRTAVQPERLNDFLSAPASNTQRAHLESLVRDSKPSVYVTDGVIKVNDANAVVLFTDMRSLANLSTLGGDYDHTKIEIVTIRIHSAAEITAGINLGGLSSFTNLKYVYILSDATISPEDINRSISNSNSGFRILYDIVKPS
ncbi:MAG: hypothetical protein EOO51_13605 [Flavobacterium sp.]|nr:MAG: hypothetical protein EOO51_13605 [Flavobacterium sp.]